jgi:hypothetical protein
VKTNVSGRADVVEDSALAQQPFVPLWWHVRYLVRGGYARLLDGFAACELPDLRRLKGASEWNVFEQARALDTRLRATLPRKAGDGDGRSAGGSGSKL